MASNQAVSFNATGHLFNAAKRTQRLGDLSEILNVDQGEMKRKACTTIRDYGNPFCPLKLPLRTYVLHLLF